MSFCAHQPLHTLLGQILTSPFSRSYTFSQSYGVTYTLRRHSRRYGPGACRRSPITRQC
jgi:hypothetical protein